MMLNVPVNRVLNILLVFISINLLSFTLTSCSESKASETTEYYCPMKCEGEKSYPKEGSCPVCEMHLKGKN